MNKSEFKTLLKPLIKECIKEVLFEENGVLAKIITETINGVSFAGNNVILNETKTKNNYSSPKYSKQTELQREELKRAAQEKQTALSEKAKILANVTGFSKVFDEVKPLSTSGQSLNESSGGSIRKMESQGTALRGIDPNDAGVNISGILNIIGGSKTWSKQLK